MNKKGLVLLMLVIGVGVGTVTASAEKIRCPWQCTSRQQEDDDLNLWDYHPSICTEAFTTAENELGASVPNGQRRYAGRPFRDLWMGTGWTGWWHLILDYCVDRGLWINATRNGAWPGQLRYGQTNTVTFQVPSAPELDIEELDLDGCNEGRICLRGRTFIGVTRTMNSPFLYFEDVPDGDYQVRLKADSQFETDPPFNAQRGWDVVVNGEQLSVDGEVEDHLFYELETPNVTLSRKGQNFNGSQALLNYLQDSDFFDRLGFTEIQKQNSLLYVVENLIERPYYYLTILEEASIDRISDTTVTDQDGNMLPLEQKYFAIYPTRIPIQTTGNLDFPVVNGSSVKEYGEVIIKPHMHVFWK